jgi:N-acetyl-anhydromuramyl-L-alanine amidase AmpD
VPGSSEQPAPSYTKGGAGAVTFTPGIIDRIRAAPGVQYPSSARPVAHHGDTTRRAIILHDAYGGDDYSVETMRKGRDDLRGPLSHWAVKSDGTIAFIADETQKANHVGAADHGVSNFNSIGIQVTGIADFENERQTESLVRLVADVADRWDIPTSMILSHAEVAVPHGRKVDMLQQAPIIRRMVDSVRKH